LQAAQTACSISLPRQWSHLRCTKVPALELTGNAAQPVAKAIDAVGKLAMDIPGMRSVRSALDPHVLKTVTHAGQDVAQTRHQIVKDELSALGKEWAPLIDKPDPIKAASIVSRGKTLAVDAGLDLTKFSDTASPTLADAEYVTRATGMAHAATGLLGYAARE
jgi:hypothetical protein